MDVPIDTSQGPIPLELTRSRAYHYWKKAFLTLIAAHRMQHWRRYETKVQCETQPDFPFLDDLTLNQDQEENSYTSVKREAKFDPEEQSTNLEEKPVISDAFEDTESNCSEIYFPSAQEFSDLNTNASSIPSPQPEWEATTQPSRPVQPVARYLNGELTLDNYLQYFPPPDIIRPVPL